MKKTIISIALIFTMAIPAMAKGPSGSAGKSPKAHLYLYERGSDGEIVEKGSWGKMVYDKYSEMFKFVFNAHKMMAGEDYTLIYIPSPSLEKNLVCLGGGTTDEYGNLHIKEAVDINGLTGDDWEIWLAKTDDVDCENQNLIISACTTYTSPGTAGIDISFGHGAWNYIDNIKTEDGLYATTDNKSSNHIIDISARLVLDNNNVGSTNYSYPGNWSDILQYIEYNHGLWNEDLTPAIINNPNFGFALGVGGGHESMISHHLTATNFGFSIPNEATITNVAVRVKRQEALGASDANTTLARVDHIEMNVCYDYLESSSSNFTPTLTK